MTRLRECQDDADGGWLLRRRDLKDPLFAFYPALLFVNLCRDDVWHDIARGVLVRTRTHLMAALPGNITLIDKVMAAHVIERIDKVVPAPRRDRIEFESHRTGLLNSLVGDSSLLVQDRIVQNNVQPRWHHVTWTGALYPCTRRWGSATAPYNVLVGDRLLRDFDPENGAWHGVRDSRGRGRSWATSLGLRATYLLAADLQSQGLDAYDWQRLVDEVVGGRKFDVVISFGGPDRPVAEAIRDHLVAAGLSVFYDDDFQHQLLGEDLAVLLQFEGTHEQATRRLRPALFSGKYRGPRPQSHHRLRIRRKAHCSRVRRDCNKEDSWILVPDPALHRASALHGTRRYVADGQLQILPRSAALHTCEPSNWSAHQVTCQAKFC